VRILAIERPVEGASEADFTPELGRAEARQAWRLHQAGVIRELYFQADRPTAVLVLECDDVVAARVALASLPMAAAGLIGFEILPLRAYPGFERLFATTDDRGRTATR
jgi:muconolactone delta-isomerase